MKLLDNGFDLLARIDYGIRMGAANAKLLHKLGGWPITVLENGQIIKIPAEEIKLDTEIKLSPVLATLK